MLDRNIPERYVTYITAEAKKNVVERVGRYLKLFLFSGLATLCLGMIFGFAAVAGLTVPGETIIVGGIASGIGRWYYEKELHRRFLQTLRASTPLWATLVMANQEIFKPGKANAPPEKYPALVFVTFDPALADDPVLLNALVQRLFFLSENPGNIPSIHEEIQEILTERPIVREGNRVPLPQELIENSVVYVVDLFIHRHFLKDGFITPEMRRIPCLVSPESKGGIWQLPYDMIRRD